MVYAVLHALQVPAQAAIDFVMHSCALLGITTPTPIRCARELYKRGLLSEDEADLLARLVRFRNIVVHEYGDVDLDRVERVLEGRSYVRVLEVLSTLYGKLKNMGLADP